MKKIPKSKKLPKSAKLVSRALAYTEKDIKARLDAEISRADGAPCKYLEDSIKLLYRSGAVEDPTDARSVDFMFEYVRNGGRLTGGFITSGYMILLRNLPLLVELYEKKGRVQKKERGQFKLVYSDNKSTAHIKVVKAINRDQAVKEANRRSRGGFHLEVVKKS